MGIKLNHFFLMVIISQTYYGCAQENKPEPFYLSRIFCDSPTAGVTNIILMSYFSVELANL